MPEKSRNRIVRAENDIGAIEQALEALSAGDCVVYPTETFYAIGADATSASALERLFAIKRRDADKPVALIVADLAMARQVAERIPDAALRLAEKFWPGPLTMVLPAKVKYNKWVTHGATTLGLRVTEHPVAQKLAKYAGGVIVSTSANISGDEPAKSAKEAREIFGNKVDIIIDGGSSPRSESSTVVDLSGDEVRLLRKGPISGDQIMETLQG